MLSVIACVVQVEQDSAKALGHFEGLGRSGLWYTPVYDLLTTLFFARKRQPPASDQC